MSATIRLCAWVARADLESLEGVDREAVVQQAIAAKREHDALQARVRELARDSAVSHSTCIDTDWRETEGDEWGPTVFHAPGSECVWCRVDHRGFSCTGETPPDVVRALLRAHDLRTKAPGTECVQCGFKGREQVLKSTGLEWEKCRYCHGSGRNLTAEELERYERVRREKEGA